MLMNPLASFFDEQVPFNDPMFGRGFQVIRNSSMFASLDATFHVNDFEDASKFFEVELSGPKTTLLSIYFYKVFNLLHPSFFWQIRKGEGLPPIVLLVAWKVNLSGRCQII